MGSSTAEWMWAFGLNVRAFASVCVITHTAIDFSGAKNRCNMKVHIYELGHGKRTMKVTRL